MSNSENPLRLFLSIGLLILFIMGILFLRKKTQNSNIPGVRTAMKVGDFFVKLQFFGFLFLIGILGLFIWLGSKNKNTINQINLIIQIKRNK